MTPALRLGLRAGLAVGVLRAFWVAAEHGAGVRTAHLEWVEPSYGVFLLVGVPAVWVALSRTRRRAAEGDAAWWAVGLTAGLLAGLLHTAIHGAYAAWVNPITWSLSPHGTPPTPPIRSRSLGASSACPHSWTSWWAINWP